MRETMTRMAIKFGKKVWGALVSAVAMLIGECILGLFTKGFNKFRVNRELRKQETITAEEVTVETTVIPEPEIPDPEQPAEDSLVDDTNN